jgi:ParB/RepB/Spo0J family partition protein
MPPNVKVSRGQMTVVPLSAINPDPAQPRKEFSKDRLAELAQSLKQVGVMVPLLVRRGEKGVLIIIDGERRWRAAKEAKLKTVPVLLQDDSGDAAQRRIEQLAINNVREALTPMELARMLHDLQHVEKLTANEIAKRMSEAGFEMTRQETERAMQLVNLPAWAQAMIDAEQLDAKAAALIVPVARNPTDKEAMRPLKQMIEERIGWRGKVVASEVSSAVASAYLAVGVDLTRTGPYDGKSTVYFDHRKICQGCDFYRRVGADDAICMNKDGFEKHQQEAKDAGLLPGGRRPKKTPTTPADERQQEIEAKAEKREASHAERVAEYFDGWLRQSLAAFLPTRPDVVENLRDYYAFGMPDGSRIRYAPALDPDGDALEVPSPRAGIDQYDNRHRISKARKEMLDHGERFNLTDFLGGTLSAEEKIEIAQCALASLLPRQVLELAHWLQFDVASSYRLDADYLNLKKRSQLEQIAAHAGITDLPGKVGELREYLLQFENVQKIGLPADLRLIAEAPVEPGPKEDADGWRRGSAVDDRDDEDDFDDRDLDEDDLEEAA